MIAAYTTTEPDDSTYVDVLHEGQLLFWLNWFRVSPAMLRQTVRIVGSRFKDVAEFLSCRRLPDQVRST